MYRVSEKYWNTWIYFQWIEISTLYFLFYIVFQGGGGNLNLVNRNSHPVTYYWKDQLTSKIMRLRKGVYDNPWPVEVDQLSSFERLSFWTKLTFAAVNCAIVYYLPYHFKQCITLKRDYFKTPYWGGFKCFM